ncbi:MAG TPA: methyltransferase domain-containing protein [Solirubrobacterales bacterium]
MPGTRSPALDLVLRILRCPVCGGELSRADASLRCRDGHSFDIARQGYAGLTIGVRPISGDDAPMVRARRRVLETGVYAPILAELVDLVVGQVPPPSTVVDAGCGTGYYLAGVMDALPGARGLGLDSSAHALRAAARAHPRAAAIACDLFGPLPVASASVGLVLDVFAPRNPAEFRRVLLPDGMLVVTRPTDGHLAQLRHGVKGMVGIDPEKEERLKRTFDPYFEAMHTVSTEYTARLTPAEAADLVLMTPSARHVTSDDLDGETAGALPTEVDISVLTTAYRPR